MVISYLWVYALTFILGFLVCGSNNKNIFQKAFISKHLGSVLGTSLPEKVVLFLYTKNPPVKLLEAESIK